MCGWRILPELCPSRCRMVDCSSSLNGLLAMTVDFLRFWLYWSGWGIIRRAERTIAAVTMRKNMTAAPIKIACRPIACPSKYVDIRKKNIAHLNFLNKAHPLECHFWAIHTAFLGMLSFYRTELNEIHCFLTRGLSCWEELWCIEVFPWVRKTKLALLVVSLIWKVFCDRYKVQQTFLRNMRHTL